MSIQQDVEDALEWEPSLNAAEIGVTVKDGVVTLHGTVDNYIKKMNAEDAAKKVAGVKAVVEKIEVKLSRSGTRDDEDIAAEVLRALKQAWSVPDEKIKVKVENGWVFLDGTLSWDYQRESAKSAVNHIRGVKGVLNNIMIKSDEHDHVEEKLVKDALRRHWSINADDITVTVSGTNVTLTGVVKSLYQKDEAGKIAWKTPGIWSVDNKLAVEYDYALMD